MDNNMGEEAMLAMFTQAGESFAKAFQSVQGPNGNPANRERQNKLRSWKCAELRTREFFGDWRYLLDTFLDSVNLKAKVWERVETENGKRSRKFVG